ncbi:MAG: aldo/keto reductase family oxidoreductase [Verrucomicrobiales bacterium]
MTRRRLVSNGPEISRLVLGTWRLLDDPVTRTVDGVQALLRAGLDRGITTVDTAEIYGRYAVEAALGEALRRDAGLRSKLEIVTKCGIYVPYAGAPDRKTAHYNAGADQIVASAEKSLQLLGLEALDLLLVHRPDWLTAHEETAAGLNRLLEAGKIRAAGVSNYTAAQFEALSEFVDRPLVTNQVEFSLFCLAPIHDGTFDQAQRVGWVPMAWSPLGGGRLFDPADAAGSRLREAMADLSGKYGGAAPEALAHAWVLAHPSRPVSILGTNKPERVASAARADAITLDREDWYALWEAGQGRRIP